MFSGVMRRLTILTERLKSLSELSNKKFILYNLYNVSGQVFGYLVGILS